MIKCCFRLCLASLLLVLVGCATYSDYPTYPAPPPEPEPVRPAPVVVQPQPEAVAPAPAPVVALNPAAVSLAKQARSQYQTQDYQGAIATAERGLRIERRAADLYLLLAQSYVQFGLCARLHTNGFPQAVDNTGCSSGSDSGVHGQILTRDK